MLKKKNKNGVFENIFIRDENKIFKSLDSDKNTSSLTIFAKKANLSPENNGKLVLQKGTIQTENNNGKIKSIDFEKTILNLSGIKTKSITQAKVQETKSKLLIDCILMKKNTFILNCPSEEKFEVLAEINRRFGMPLYIPFIALLCSFLLINREESKFGGLYKYYYGGLAFLTLIVAEILVRYSGSSYQYSLIYYLFPIIFIPILYLEILRKFSFENLKR